MTSIWESKLDKRIIHSLLTEGIETIDELLNTSASDLLKIPNISKKSLEKIEKFKETQQKTIPVTLATQKQMAGFETKINNLMMAIEHCNEIYSTLISKSINEMNIRINEIYKIMLEQYRIMELIRTENRPDGVIKKINEKIPSFHDTVLEIYKKLENS